MTEQKAMISGCSAITEEQIAKRAYELWEARGCPLGNGSADWRDAKEQLLAENRSSLAMTSQAGIDLTATATVLAPTEADQGEAGCSGPRGLLSRWIALLKKAG